MILFELYLNDLSELKLRDLIENTTSCDDVCILSIRACSTLSLLQKQTFNQCVADVS